MTNQPQEGRIGNTMAYYAGFIGIGLSMSALGPTLTKLADQTGTVLAEISLLFMAKSAGYLIGTFIGGRLSDRLPGNPLIAISLLTMAGMLALTPVIPVLWILSGALLIMGIAEGVLDVGANTSLMWSHGDRIGPWMNGLHFFFGVGAFLCPIIIDWTELRTGSITWSYWILAIMIVPSAFWILARRSPRNPNDGEENGNGPADMTLVPLMALFYFTFVGAEMGFGGWIFTYATKLGIADESGARLMTSVYWGALTIGRLLAIPIAARFSNKIILAVDLAGCILSVLLIMLFPENTAVLWAGAFGFGFSMASLFPTGLNFAQGLMSITGKITSWFLIGGSLGSMIIPWTIGQFFESVGPGAMLYLLLVDMVFSTMVFAGILIYCRRKQIA